MSQLDKFLERLHGSAPFHKASRIEFSFVIRAFKPETGSLYLSSQLKRIPNTVVKHVIFLTLEMH